MSHLLVLALSVSVSAALVGCATGSRMIEADPAASSARPQLDLGIAETESSQFPDALAPTVPSVDRIGLQVRAALGDTATASLQLCVSPAGTVTDVALLESSTFEAFDAALLRDAKAWQFASSPGPSTVQTCSRATIAYHPYY